MSFLSFPLTKLALVLINRETSDQKLRFQLCSRELNKEIRVEIVFISVLTVLTNEIINKIIFYDTEPKTQANGKWRYTPKLI